MNDAKIIACLIAIALLTVGCQTSGGSGALETRVPHARLTSSQLRAVLIDFMAQLTSRIEASADEIVARAESPAIHKSALLWKLHAIPAGYQAALRRDALAAAVDLWILCAQMSDLFATGAGKDCFGSSQDAVRAVSAQLQQKMRDLVALAMGEPSSEGKGITFAAVSRFVEEFAREHPVESLYLARPSVAEEYTKSFLAVAPSLADVASDLAQDLTFLQDMLRSYAGYLPKQARWEVELLMQDTMAGAEVVDLEQRVKRALDDVDAMTAMATKLPEDLRAERVAVLDVLQGQMAAALHDLERQRLEAQAMIVEQRLAVTTLLEREMATAMEQIGVQRQLAMDGMEAMATKLSAQIVLPQGKQLIDYLFVRIVQLVGILAVAGGLGFFLLRRRSGALGQG